jgi:hypothetical protein
MSDTVAGPLQIGLLLILLAACYGPLGFLSGLDVHV